MHLCLERIFGHELPIGLLYQLFDQFWQVVCGDGSHTMSAHGRLSLYVIYLLTNGKHDCHYVPKKTQKGGLMGMARGGIRCVVYGDSERMARTLRKAAGFFFWMLAICAAVALLGSAVILFLSESRFEDAGLGTLLGHETLDLAKRLTDAVLAKTATPGAVRTLVTAGAFGMCVVRAAVRVVDISGVHFRFTLNVSTLSAGLVLLVLAAVFRHGSYLQGEYDATL